ncbi:hypothetical protein PGTUg99_000966 [Puccinia graminis f. sp. tritici]|uniref:Uncharacterized protein n=1 Tax=Puccinia graminis f. sp. tritici TaxID=56615 RepID=A0A5B0RK36_PUCGR|nr:hypothetical protein PGTUg99_000966 [Puccinia graminis f. sp. tritici]
MYLADWKDFLPAGEVHVPRRPEGNPPGPRGCTTSPAFPPGSEVVQPRRPGGGNAGRRGCTTSSTNPPGTSSTGRKPFQSARYMYLAGQKDFLPVGEVHVPRRLEGNPSSRPSPLSGLGYPWGYLDIRWDFREKGASAPKSAPASGYPPAGIRQRIADIRNGLSPPISSTRTQIGELDWPRKDSMEVSRGGGVDSIPRLIVADLGVVCTWVPNGSDKTTCSDCSSDAAFVQIPDEAI